MFDKLINALSAEANSLGNMVDAAKAVEEFIVRLEKAISTEKARVSEQMMDNRWTDQGTSYVHQQTRGRKCGQAGAA